VKQRQGKGRRQKIMEPKDLALKMVKIVCDHPEAKNESSIIII
jgi:hypothetical protein